MVVVLDLAKDRGVDPGHGGRIHCGWWRFGASSDCSGRHHPRRWQLILNVVRELLLSKGQKHILLNLGNVNYIDSSGIGELVSAFTTVRNENGDLKLLNLTKRVIHLLQITKLSTVFDVKDDEVGAIKSFNADAAANAA